MSSAKVRDAIVQFLKEPAIPGIQNVYRDVPWFVDGAAWEIYSYDGWAAIACVHINSTNETRVTLPFATGSKRVDHQVAVLIQYQYLIPNDLAPQEYEDSWVDGLDSVIDAVKERIRSNFTFNSNGVVWQAGEGQNDLSINRDVPRTDNGRVHSWNVIEFSLTEIIQA
jgi:hypothetical protein